MSKNRCPWCGKLINRFQDQRGVRKKETPRFLRFACCSHCNNYYGQNCRSPRSLITLLMSLAALVIGYTLGNGFIVLLSVPIVITVVFIPLQRMDENEQPIIENAAILKGVFLGDGRLMKKEYYMLVDDYDSREYYSAVSPISIVSFNNKTKEAKFVFLYDHPLNHQYLNQGAFDVFDYNAEKLGTIRVI